MGAVCRAERHWDLVSTGLAVWCQNSEEDHGEHTPGPTSGVWDMGQGGPWHLVVLLSSPPAPPRAGHAVSLQPNTGHVCGSRGRAGLATATATTALPCPQEPRQPSPTHHPNFTWKHVHMDATALQHPAINSMQAMAGVAGCFAINSREKGSSCDSLRVLSIEPGAALVFSVE